MPAYQSESWIVNAVNSVLGQTHRNWELIIVADDLVDYRKVLAQYNITDSRIDYLSTKMVQAGPNVARNIGLSAAQGDWIAPLDTDDIYYPDRLEKLLIAGEQTGLSLDNVYVCRGKSYEEKSKIYHRASGNFYFSDFKQSLAPLLLLFRRDLISQGWDEDIIRGADTIFNLRGLERAGYAVYLQDALHEYRVHNASMCHAPGSDTLFIDAYAHTLHRLQRDGLGFRTNEFLREVIDMIAEKQQINEDYNRAVNEGFEGNYQEFVQAREYR